MPVDRHAGIAVVQGGVVEIDESGRFEVPGLLPGEYDLLAELKEDAFFTSSRIPHRFGPFEAGAREQALPLDTMGAWKKEVEGV